MLTCVLFMLCGYTIKTVSFLMLMDCPRFRKFLAVTPIFGFLKEKEEQVEHFLVLINICHKCCQFILSWNTSLRLLALSQSSILYCHVDTLQQVLAHTVYFEALFSVTILYMFHLKCSGDAGCYA